MRKKILLITAGLLGVMLLAAIILPFVIDLNKFRDQIIPPVQDATGRTLTFDSIDLTVLTGVGAELTNVALSEDPAFGDGNFFEVDAVHAKLNLLPLLAGRVRVTIIIKAPRISLIKNAKGILNVSTIGPTDADTLDKDEEQTPTEEQADEGLPSFVNRAGLARLVIKNGELTYDDRSVKPVAMTAIHDLDVTLNDVAFGETVELDLGLGYNAEEQNVFIEGEVGPLTEALILTPPEGETPPPADLDADLTIKVPGLAAHAIAELADVRNAPTGTARLETTEMDLRILSQTFGDALPAGAKLDGDGLLRVTVEGRVDESRATASSPRPHMLALKGSLNLDDATIIIPGALNKTSATPLSMDFAATVTNLGTQQKSPALSLNPLDLKYGKTKMKLTATVADVAGDSPKIDFALTSPLVVVDELLPPETPTSSKKPASPKASQSQPPSSGGPWVNKGTISIKEIRYDKIRVTDYASSLYYRNDALTLSSQKLTVFKGAVSAPLRVDLSKPEPRWSMTNLSVQHLDLGEAVAAVSEDSSFRMQGALKAAAPTLSGRGGDPTKLRGNAKLTISDGRIVGRNLGAETLKEVQQDQQFGGLLKLLTGSGADSRLNLSFLEGEDTVFERIHANLQFTPTHYQIRTADLRSRGLRLTSKGKVRHDLHLNLKGRLTLSKADSKILLRDKQVRKLLTNNKSEFTIPYTWKGRYDDSKPTPDLEDFGKQVMKKFQKTQKRKLMDNFFGGNKKGKDGKKAPKFKLPF